MESPANTVYKVFFVMAIGLSLSYVIYHSQSEVQSNTACVSAKSIIAAKSLRDGRGEDSGPYLGTGDIPEYFVDFNTDEAQGLFHSAMIHESYDCPERQRVGKAGDGGYYVCTQGKYRPTQDSCLVYSFGINNEWSFDEQMNAIFGCEVHSFDPSMNKEDHMHKPGIHFHNLGIWGFNKKGDNGWQLRDLATIIGDLQHEGRVLDYLKIDVEGAEWSLVEHIVRSGVYEQIKQMVVEIHTPRPISQHMSVLDYGEAYNSFHKLEQVGFQKYLFQTNNNCCGGFPLLVSDRIYEKDICCYELFFVNKLFQ